MEKIIQKAIEGGWGKEHVVEIFGVIYTFGEKIKEKEIVLDPLFWQALGKASGWSQEGWYRAGGAFHQKNLTQGWSVAVAYLEALIEEK